MNNPALAAAFALMAAVGSATFSIIIRKGQRYGNAATGVLIGMLVGTPILLAATALLWEPGWWHPRAYALFIAAGLAGPCFGRMFIFLGIHHLGVSRAIPLKSIQPLAAAMLAYTILCERPGPFIWGGTILIVAGCVAFSLKRKDDTSWSRRHIWLPLAAVVTFASGAILRKLGLGMLQSPLLGVTFTSLAGLVFFLGFSFVMPRSYRPDLRWGKAWYFYGACGLINTLTFLLSFHAIMRGDITVVTPISSMAPFFALVMSHLFLRDVERVTGPVVLGTVFTVAGGAIIGWRVL